MVKFNKENDSNYVRKRSSKMLALRDQKLISGIWGLQKLISLMYLFL